MNGQAQAYPGQQHPELLMSCVAGLQAVEHSATWPLHCISCKACCPLVPRATTLQ